MELIVAVLLTIIILCFILLIIIGLLMIRNQKVLEYRLDLINRNKFDVIGYYTYDNMLYSIKGLKDENWKV